MASAPVRDNRYRKLPFAARFHHPLSDSGVRCQISTIADRFYRPLTDFDDFL